jgi:hypothetical protein
MTIIAIDYDCTYTIDPLLWDSFIFLAQQRGHTVYCVTARNEKYGGQQVKDALQHIVDGIYFTDNMPKRSFMQNLGIFVGVFIDDQPEGIVSYGD